MGMSASQARLLSITTRLTNNEFRAQTITNSKLRLAEKSEEASAEYMDALNSQTLNFRYYDSNGDAQTYKLTPAFLYSYEALKSQYAIQNTSGQYLVSKVDADNFYDSDNLYTFLGKYGLTDDSEWTQYESALDKYTKDLSNYEKALEKWKADIENYNSYKKYQNELDAYNSPSAIAERSIAAALWAAYDEELNLYNIQLGQPDLAEKLVSCVGSATDPANPPQYCYSNALGGDDGCFLHFLNFLLTYRRDDPNQEPRLHTDGFTTTTGQAISANGAVGAMSWVIADSDKKEGLVLISAAINDTTYPRRCDGDDDLSTTDSENLLEQINDVKNSSLTQAEKDKKIELLKLQSDYILKSDGSYEIKTLKQKAIDMYYLISHKGDYGIDTDMMKSMLINFTDGDLKKLTSAKPTQPSMPRPGNAPEPVPVATDPGDAPEPPKEPVKPSCEMNLIDGDKAQWYVNLWHLMNGSSTANVVRKRQSTEDDEYGVTAGKDFYQVEDCDRNASAELNYKVMDDKESALWTSPEWLQFALENGIVTLVKAQYYNPSDNGGKVLDNDREGISWNSIIYTNAPDLSYVDNETAIAIAEVKYKNAVSEIETKDKKYDQDLKKLDTEHTALQTEYESIKSVIDKNVERSFKAFS